jgi:hypothetical protein
VADTLGLLEEARQLAKDLGYHVREEALGDLPGGPCTVGGVRHVLLNLEHTAAERLDRLLAAIGGDIDARGGIRTGSVLVGEMTVAGE